MQSAIGDMLSQIPCAEVSILGNFNTQNDSSLGSRTTDHAWRVVFDFAKANGLSQNLLLGPSADFTSGIIAGRRRCVFGVFRSQPGTECRAH